MSAIKFLETGIDLMSKLYSWIWSKNLSNFWFLICFVFRYSSGLWSISTVNWALIDISCIIKHVMQEHKVHVPMLTFSIPLGLASFIRRRPGEVFHSCTVSGKSHNHVPSSPLLTLMLCGALWWRLNYSLCPEDILYCWKCLLTFWSPFDFSLCWTSLQKICQWAH